MAASSKLPSLDRCELTRILNLYRICFEAAVKACRPPSVTSFRRNKHDPLFWEVHLSENITARGEVPEDAQEDMVHAFQKWNLCDHFCSMLYEALRKHLREYGAEVYWDIFKPAPQMVLMNPHDKPAYPRHSHLMIQTEAKETFHFDCTREQFGWSDSNWLTEPREFAACMADMLEETKDGASVHEGMRDQFGKSDEGYWSKIFASFDELFERLVWEKQRSEKPERVEQLFRDKAEKLAEAAARTTWGPKPRH